MDSKRLITELNERGTAEVVNGEVLQVTQALGESPGKAKFITFGELHDCGVIPIEVACAHCHNSARVRFATVGECQARQGREAKARGFTSVVCPNQFVETQGEVKV